MRTIGQRAVVLGGGMSGLLAARVLAEAYQRVTVVERDALPDSPRRRRGVPQARHIHSLHVPGKEILDELFPGLVGELVDAGAPVAPAYERVRLVVGGRETIRAATGRRVLLSGRPFLEFHVRRRTAALPNVEILDECDVTGLVADGGRITGVRVVRGSAEIITADLVVDAMGRGGRTPSWLTGLGYPAPAEQEMRVGVGYSSRELRLPAQAVGGDLLTLVTPRPGLARGIGLFAQEDGRWLCTLIGMAGDHPPADDEGFVAFASTVAPPDVLAALRAAEPLSEIATHRFPTSRWRRYDRLRRFPDGLLVIGDAICSFNPIYGQGMTVAAQEAAALRRCLAGGERNLARRFFAATRPIIGRAWQMSTGADLALPEIDAPRPLPVRLITAYMRRLQRRLPYDAKIAEAFGRAVNLELPPQALMSPRLAFRVLRPLRAAQAPSAPQEPVRT